MVENGLSQLVSLTWLHACILTYTIYADLVHNQFAIPFIFFSAALAGSVTVVLESHVWSEPGS